MGIFSRFVKSGKSTGKSGKDSQDFSYIYEIAELISDNDTKIKSLLSQNGSTKVSDTDALWLDMTEKLEEYGYAFSIDYKAELEDFLWSLEQLKSYSLIEACVSSLKLNPEMDIDAWGEEINLALSGKAYVCTIDTDSDSYGIIIVTEKILEKISSIAESHGREIYDF
ncbi:MAG: hypothetical protein HFK00_01370 [Oscillospiraceae bacterium]|nr:hypothetical protein [Oscillospiraceae bacterium]